MNGSARFGWVLAIAAAHGGTLSARRRPEGGTTLTFTLPVPS